jgi:hypothetical protein
LSSRDEAIKHLQTLINGKKPNIFKYKINNPHYVLNKDGSVDVIYPHKSEVSDTSTLYNINAYFYRLYNKVKIFIKDLIYYIKNYNFECGGSHNRTEWYCLIDHIMSDLKYNIPIMLKDGHSYCSEFNKMEDWRDCLLDFLLLMQEYDFYDKYMLPKTCDSYYKQFGHKFIQNHNRLVNSIPYYEYSYDINYAKAYELQEKNWNDICQWFMKYGRNLWD